MRTAECPRCGSLLCGKVSFLLECLYWGNPTCIVWEEWPLFVPESGLAFCSGEGNCHIYILSENRFSIFKNTYLYINSENLVFKDCRTVRTRGLDAEGLTRQGSADFVLG